MKVFQEVVSPEVSKFDNAIMNKSFLYIEKTLGKRK